MALETYDEDWSTALAIVAHPDDLEYGGAAAIARWTSQGKHISYLLVTRGEAGIDSMDPAEAAVVREAEQRESARIVGVEQVDFLDHPDGVIEYSVALRRDLAAAIRRAKPEVIITGNFRESFPGGTLNMADHIAVGRAVMDAVRDAGNRWVFRDLDLEKWGGVRDVLAMASPNATHGVDVGEHLAAGIASLEAHAAYVAGLGDGFPPPDEFLESIARMGGGQLGCTFAVTFEVLHP